jgi:DNA-binding CsgD family transcriptional regulator/tetratricopeptide (TPR) repeat protein
VAERGAALCIVGDPGIGKTALLGAFAADAVGEGMAVLSATGVRSETHLPFAALHELLDPIVERIGALQEAQRDALLGALGQSDRQVLDVFMVAVATLNLLRDCADDRPLLVIIDDLQWLDSSSADVLAFVARRLDADPIVLVASSREEPTGALADAQLVEIGLAGLGPTDAATLVDTHAPGLEPGLRDRLLAESAGNPLALVELAIAWNRLAPGTLLGKWSPITSRVRDTFAARLSALDPASRAVLLVAALDDGADLHSSLVAASSLVGRPVTLGELGPAVDARLVELDARSFRFRHPLVRAAVYDLATPQERRVAHEVLADILDDDRSIWHAAAAATAPDPGLATALDEVAAGLRRRAAVTGAITALERAAALSDDPTSRGRRLVLACELAMELGRTDVAARLLDEADDLELDPRVRARSALRRKLLSDGVWRDTNEVRSLVAVAEDVGAEGDLETALSTLTTVAVTGWWTNFDAERRALVVGAIERLAPPSDDARVLASLGMADPVGRGAWVLEQIDRLDASTIVDPAVLNMLGGVASVLGSSERAADLLDRAIAGFRESGQLSLLSGTLASRSWAAWHLGDWNLGASLASEGSRMADQTNRPAHTASARAAEAAFAAARGNTSVAEAIASDLERTFRPLNALPIVALALHAHGIAALADGRSDAAYDYFREQFDLQRTGETPVVNQMSIAPYVDAAVQSGHRDEARELMREVAKIAKRSASPHMQIAVAYAAPLLADDDDAEGDYRRALDSSVRRRPFLYGRLLLAYGRWLRRHRQVRESRPPLREARAIFDTLGAVPWETWARQELRAAGEAGPDRSANLVAQLTAQEIEIARLAASGISNREIGQQLCLSHRTIGSHLYRIFPKLGITSRGQLASALAIAGLAP